MIRSQTEAETRIKELVSKYNLGGLFDSADADRREIAHKLWKVAIESFDAEDYPSVLEIVELCFFLDSNCHYSYIMGVAHFYTDMYSDAAICFENALKLIDENAPLYPPLASEININLIKTQLYRMLIESYIRMGQYDEALAVWDNNGAYFDNEYNPDVLTMIAQLLAASQRVEEASAILDKATALANAISDDEVKNDCLSSISQIRLLIIQVITDMQAENVDGSTPSQANDNNVSVNNMTSAKSGCLGSIMAIALFVLIVTAVFFAVL